MDNFLAQGEARCEFCAAGDEFDFAAVSPPISNVDFKIDTSDPTPIMQYLKRQSTDWETVRD
jgi:hypothetical protein